MTVKDLLGRPKLQPSELKATHYRHVRRLSSSSFSLNEKFIRGSKDDVVNARASAAREITSVAGGFESKVLTDSPILSTVRLP
jgi:hypothetical protein